MNFEELSSRINEDTDYKFNLPQYYALAESNPIKNLYQDNLLVKFGIVKTEFPSDIYIIASWSWRTKNGDVTIVDSMFYGLPKIIRPRYERIIDLIYKCTYWTGKPKKTSRFSLIEI